MEDLYEPVVPYDVGALEVGDGQTLYWETVGTPQGLPAVWLHGGPGSGSTPEARRHFDPYAYRAALFDQRGCGRSRPLVSEPDANLSVNTTDHLVADIERLRTHLRIDRWVVVGVSWGVTLGLIYAQRHPDRVLAMVLGAVTAGTRREAEWITRDMGRIFPRAWERFAQRVPPAERAGELAAAYARLLADPDPQVRDTAAKAWCEWEDAHVSFGPGLGAEPPIRRPDLPKGIRSPGHSLLESQLLPCRWRGARRHAAPRRHSRHTDPRPLRRVGPARDGLGGSPLLGRQQARRTRRHRTWRCQPLGPAHR
jgi:proline iminopeptidase